MKYILLVVGVVLVSLQSTMMKQYDRKTDTPNPVLYSVVLTFFAMVFFTVTSLSGFRFVPEVIPYAIGNGIAYAAATVSMNYAISWGPLSITALINAYSLMVPTMYGILFLKEPVGMVTYLGIGLLLVSLFLINKKKEEMVFSFRWLIAVIINFVGNGLSSIIQKMQQMRFQGAYKNEYMVIALAVAFILLIIVAAVSGTDLKKGVVQCCKYASVAGAANGMSNLAVMFLIGLMPSAILFPLFSAGSIGLMFFISLLIYREKLSKTQVIGYMIGIVSIVFLNM